MYYDLDYYCPLMSKVMTFMIALLYVNNWQRTVEHVVQDR